jgi:hypothetical protein
MTLYYYNKNGECIDGPNPRMRGDYSELWGDCTWLLGDCGGLRGHCTWLGGDCTGLTLDLDCIPDRMRASELSIAEIEKLLKEKAL